MFVGKVGPILSVVLWLTPAVSRAHSLGMKYLTPAAMAASTRAMCLRSKPARGWKLLKTMTASAPLEVKSCTRVAWEV
jgi:hypothetical protein